MKKVLALALALVLTLAVSVSLADQSFMLDLATAYAADAPAGIALQKFVDDVNEKSGGSIDISLFTDGTLGNTTDNYASVASGDLDMTMSGLEGLDLYAPEYTFLDSPFLVKDWDHMTALLNSGFVDTFRWFHPDARDEYSWWSYRFHAREKNAGWRIDYFIVSERLKDSLESAGIHQEVFGSDHCPVELILRNS